MNKKIQDYLHLYLGCFVSGIYGIGYLRGIDKNGWCMVTWKKNMAQGDEDYTQNDKEAEIKHVKPLLRPLSSMTEEEMDQVVELGGLYRRGDTVEQFTATWKAFGADVFVWLLSHHFDLFGLIDAGLAIDKTSIK